MARPEPRLAPDTDLFAWLKSLRGEKRRRALLQLGPAELEAFEAHWKGWSHKGQRPPDTCEDGSPWSTWVLMAGRGFGKTRAGAEWIVEQIDAAAAAPGPTQPFSIALVGATLDDARRVMVEGPSGLIHVAGARIREWNPSLRRLTFTSGATATLFSGASPEQLRGPEHHLAWCDELAKWEKPQESWDMLQLGLRMGDRPRVLVTTTPKPGPVLTAIMEEPGTVKTGGTSYANPHTSAAWKRAAAARYEGTRLGRQELHGELLPDKPGALWSVELLEKCRAQESDRGPIASQPVEPASDVQPAPPRGDRTDVTDLLRDGAAQLPFTKIVIGVDPPTGDGTCGITACAKDAAGHAHVLADHSVTARTPEGWSGAVAAAARAWGALHPGVPVTAVAESNQGGEMIKAVLRTADPALRTKLVHARHGKAERATPVAMLFETGQITLHARFPELEAQLCGMIAGGDYEGPGGSPDRADAMVWALTELMLTKERPEPRVRGFT